MVQHGEGRGAREAAIFKRERGSVAVDHVDVGPGEPVFERGSKHRVDFDGGQPGDRLSEDVGRQAGARPHLEHVLAQVARAQRPGQDFQLDGCGPFGTRTDLEMAIIHSINTTTSTGDGLLRKMLRADEVPTFGKRGGVVRGLYSCLSSCRPVSSIKPFGTAGRLNNKRRFFWGKVVAGS